MATPLTGSVDHALAVDEDGLFLTGWLGGAAAGAEVRLAGGSKGDGRLELAYRFRRLDIEDAGYPGRPHGFACLVEAPGAALRASNLRLEIVGTGGGKAALGIPDPVLDPVAARHDILRVLELGHASDTFLAQDVYPAIERLRRMIEPGLAIADVRELGRVPTGAEVSIVVLLEGSLESLTPQLALLTSDPDVRDAEIILVLDSPELEPRLSELTHHLHRLYGQPLRVVTLAQSAGVAYANNLGAANASGEFLILLGSDVFPDTPGWIPALTEPLRGEGPVMAAGPKLLFEDRSVHHAGMYFERDAAGHWEKAHFHAGMPGSLPAVNEPRRVPALTAACLAMARSDFDKLGRFDPTYALGDYEDSDLCLRLQESGRECWYVPQAELFHLAPRSSRADIGPVTYNRWLLNHRWGAAIESLMEEFQGNRPAVSSMAGRDS